MSEDHRSNHNRRNADALPHDELDGLLRTWHRVNADHAASGRAELMARIAAQSGMPRPGRGIPAGARPAAWRPSWRGLVQGRGFRAAASLALLIASMAMIVSVMQSGSAAACDQIMVPEGGRLEAVDRHGNLIGPCALAHTDVNVAIAGPFTRVNVKQEYQNPYNRKIEAVYTFPLSNRAAVDGMTMTIPSPGGDRVIVAESRERRQARQIYDSARQAGHIATLLEQERPNIFTQSVANIEPGAKIIIEISYVEMLQSKDGEYTFDFPMVVAPRYIPGQPIRGSMADQTLRLPNELERRLGIILKAPGSFERVKLQVDGAMDPNSGQGVNITTTPIGAAPFIGRLIDAAIPIEPPSNDFRMREENQKLLHSRPGIDFYVTYADGSREFGQISGEGLGHLAGRWFYLDPALLDRFENQGQSGTGYENDTNQVPDASRITPQPVRPPMRAGHDVSLKVSIETGGPAIIDYASDLHEITCTDGPRYRNLGDKINLALRNKGEIPNRDFVLRWKTNGAAVQESAFALCANPADGKGGFFTLVLAPPARIDKDNIVPRELVFVLDTSGSMSGEPLEKAKAVMARAIDAMWPADTFNIITFSGDTHILWDRPRPNTEANRAEAQQFLSSRSGDGGTEMMKAIDAALAPCAPAADTITAAQLADLPADGRAVRIRAAFDDIEAQVMKSAVMDPVLRVRPDLALRLSAFQFPVEQMHGNPQLVLAGTWATINGERVLQVAAATRLPDDQPAPLRIVMFLTDGQVGNDEAIIQAVRDHAKTARVFSFGIGDSPNRNLLDGMAKAGRGEVEYVNLQNNPDAAVQRFARRIASPVLTDISLAFGPGVTVSDTIPPLDAIPDLFDVKPLIIHGRFTLDGNASGNGAAGATGGTGVSPVKTTVTLRGRNAAGPYEHAIELDLAAQRAAPAVIGARRAAAAGTAIEEDPHRVLATLWARAMVGELGQAAGREPEVIALGERFNIMTPLTSFVAVEKARVTIAGQPMLVPIPVELPEGEQWEKFFQGRTWQTARAHASVASPSRDALISKVKSQGVDAAMREVRDMQLAGRFDDALAMVDAILAVDAQNPSAAALRDVLRAAGYYGSYKSINQHKELGLSELSVEVQRSMVQPIEGRKPQLAEGTTGEMNYGIDVDELSQIIGNWGVPGTGDSRELRDTSVETLEFAWQRGILADADGDGFTDSHFWKGQAPSTGSNQVYFLDGQAAPFITDSGTSSALRAHAGVMIAAQPQIGRNAVVNMAPPDFSGAPGINLPDALEAGQAASGGTGGFGGGGGGGSGGRMRAEQGQLKDPLVYGSPGQVNFGLAVAPDTSAPPPPPPPPPPDSQVGGGIFGDAGEDPTRPFTPQAPAPPPTEEQLRSQVIVALQSTIHPSQWAEQGGRLASLTFDQGRFVFKPLTPDPQSQAVVDDGRAFLEFMRQNISAIAPLGAVDAPPAQPFAETATVCIYDLRDFKSASGGAIEAQTIANLLMETIEPESWKDLGGADGTINIVQQSLIIRTTPANHALIREFLGLVRLALQPAAPPGQRLETPMAGYKSSPNLGGAGVTGGAGGAGGPGGNPAAPADRKLVIYDVRDLLECRLELPQVMAAKQLVDLITECVDPETWDITGGDVGSIRTLDANFIITTTDAIHARVHRLLDQLRTAVHDANTTPVRESPPTAAAAANAAAPERIIYWIGDLLQAGSGPPAREDLLRQVVDIIQENIDPDGWRELGGDRGTLLPWNDWLVIINAPASQKSIEGLLAQLRDVRSKAPAYRAAEPAQPPAPVLPNPPQPAQPQPEAANKSEATKQPPPADPAAAAATPVFVPGSATASSLPAPKESPHARQHRVIDQRLWPAAFGVTEGGSLTTSAAPIRIVILAADTDAATLEKLTAAGLQVDDSSRTAKVIAGAIAGPKLPQLALIKAVKRIVPLE